MNREEAYRELKELNLNELFMKDMHRQRFPDEANAHHQMLEMATVCFESYNVSPNLENIIHDFRLNEQDQANISGQLERVRESSISSHYRSETFSLDANRKISLVKHSRYGMNFPHDHDFFEIAYLFTGSCNHEFFIGNERIITTLNEGDFVIIPPGLTHNINIMDDSLMVNILVHTQTFRSAFLSQLPENNTLYRFFSDVLLSGARTSYILMQHNSPRLRDLLLDLYIEQKDLEENPGDSYSLRISEHLLQIFFLEIIRSKRTTMELSHFISEADRLGAALLLFVENNYQSTSLQDVSERFHFSRTYVNRIFKRTTGTTLQQYIKQLRLDAARKLLQDSSVSVSEAAEAVGYHDTSYFIEEYKKAFGRTPRGGQSPKVGAELVRKGTGNVTKLPVPNLNSF